MPGSLSPRGRSFDECVDDMQRAEELRIVLNDAAASSSRNSSQGSGGGGWSSSDEEEADPMEQDEEGPPQKPTNILSCLGSFVSSSRYISVFLCAKHRFWKWEK